MPRDSLNGLLKHGDIKEQVGIKLERTRRSGKPASLAMLGIDFPQDMLGAVSAMRDQPLVNQDLSEAFVMVYCENKRQDHLALMQEVSAREYRWFM